MEKADGHYLAWTMLQLACRTTCSWLEQLLDELYHNKGVTLGDRSASDL